MRLVGKNVLPPPVKQIHAVGHRFGMLLTKSEVPILPLSEI